MNGNFTILGSRLYSPNLKDAAGLEDAQLIYTFVYSLFPRTSSTQPNLQTNVWKIWQINRASSSQTTCFKLVEYNLLPRTLTLRFTTCVKFNFSKSYLPSDSQTNTVISDSFAYPSIQEPDNFILLTGSTRHHPGVVTSIKILIVGLTRLKHFHCFIPFYLLWYITRDQNR